MPPVIFLVVCILTKTKEIQLQLNCYEPFLKMSTGFLFKCNLKEIKTITNQSSVLDKQSHL